MLPSTTVAAGRWFPSCVLMRLVLLFTNLLAVALAGKRLLDALLFTWLQVERMTLDFLDDVFGLNLTLETTERVFERFAFLNTDLCQEMYTSSLPYMGNP